MLKILIVKLSAIGDVIHCLPVAAALKASLPDCHLAWLVDKGSAELLENNKCVDEVITFDGKAWSRDMKNPSNWLRVGGEAARFMRQLRAKGFDVALEMQGLFKSGVLALGSGASIRMGFDGTREFAESFLTHRINVGDYFGHDIPVVELNLKIVDALLKLLGRPAREGSPRFNLPATTAAVWQKTGSLLANSYQAYVTGISNFDNSRGVADVSDLSKFAEFSYIRNELQGSDALLKSGAPVGARPAQLAGLEDVNSAPPAKVIPDVPSTPQAMPSTRKGGHSVRRLCVLLPGTTWVTKIWPEEYWYQLGLELIEEFDYTLLIVGAKSELDANGRLSARLNSFRPDAAVDLTSKTTLLDLAALFKCSNLVIGGDTGPLHLAAAVGTSFVVGIYGSTPWRRNGPYGEHCRSVSLNLDCQPCYSKHCKIKTIDCLQNLSVDRVMSVINQLQGVV